MCRGTSKLAPTKGLINSSVSLSRTIVYGLARGFASGRRQNGHMPIWATAECPANRVPKHQRTHTIQTMRQFICVYCVIAFRMNLGYMQSMLKYKIDTIHWYMSVWPSAVYHIPRIAQRICHSDFAYSVADNNWACTLSARPLAHVSAYICSSFNDVVALQRVMNGALGLISCAPASFALRPNQINPVTRAQICGGMHNRPNVSA